MMNYLKNCVVPANFQLMLLFDFIYVSKKKRCWNKKQVQQFSKRNKSFLQWELNFFAAIFNKFLTFNFEVKLFNTFLINFLSSVSCYRHSKQKKKLLLISDVFWLQLILILGYIDKTNSRWGCFESKFLPQFNKLYKLLGFLNILTDGFKYYLYSPLGFLKRVRGSSGLEYRKVQYENR